MHAGPALVRWLFETAWSRGETDDLAHRLGTHTFHYRDRVMALAPSDLADLIDGWRTGFPTWSSGSSTWWLTATWSRPAVA